MNRIQYLMVWDYIDELNGLTQENIQPTCNKLINVFEALYEDEAVNRAINGNYLWCLGIVNKLYEIKKYKTVCKTVNLKINEIYLFGCKITYIQ